MSRGRTAGAFVLWLVGLGANAGAQNLVANGDFDTGLESWTLGSMAAFTWNPADWQGNPASGSGRHTNQAPCAGTSVRQCLVLPLPLAASYELGAAVSFQGGPGMGSATVWATTYEGTSCAGVGTASFLGPASTVPGQWDSFLTPGLELPESTGAVAIDLVVTKPFVPGCPGLPTISALFDHVRFGPTGTTPVALESFAIE